MTLLTFITILTVADVLALIADLVILYKYCDAGYLGYPDEWHSLKAEKAHYALATTVLVLSITITVLMVIFGNK